MRSDASCPSGSLTLSELGQRPVWKLVQHLIDDQHRSPTGHGQRVTPGADLQSAHVLSSRTDLAYTASGGCKALLPPRLRQPVAPGKTCEQHVWQADGEA